MSVPGRDQRAVYPLAVTLAMGAVVVLSLWACLGFYRSTGARAKLIKDPYRIAVQRDRFREVADWVPAGAVVGYLSDMPISDARGSAQFYSARYVLAPRLLVEMRDAGKSEWVVGNFTLSSGYTALAHEHRLTLVKDFGRGVALFRRIR